MSAGFDWDADECGLGTVDAGGRVFLIAALGDCPDARAAAAEWCAQAIALGRTATVLSGADTDAVREAVDGARAGSRVMLAGAERDLMAAVAAVRAAGALPSEVTTHLTVRGGVAVFCPHCATAQDAAVAPGGRVRCATCGTVLEVRSHRSSHHGTYLGAVAEAA
ncbi:dimethylamine monooxygenase subunit DmmA family protein [Rhodococcus sp. NPDC003318]|uniref:dimethylamine monooxygenase subunit DmmA family protein n=1 Tax=Rhodococcus sp. NPDC003318 TaxID=3364503 RepID=UPI0036C10C5F